MGGDFHQVLLIVQKKCKAQMINAYILKSHLWAYTKILDLGQNMQTIQDHSSAQYLMHIRDGIEPTIQDDMVKVPNYMSIHWDGEGALNKLTQETFP